MTENEAGEEAKEKEVKASRWSLEEGGSELHPQLHTGRKQVSFQCPALPVLLERWLNV